ncbi:hypothetical protein HK098_001696 [Nowakowskiella sp. JEL0407]|nr:hypothetical protein HK098_001696 [Nowakowskiella sp. JEL0407]
MQNHQPFSAPNSSSYLADTVEIDVSSSIKSVTNTPVIKTLELNIPSDPSSNDNPTLNLTSSQSSNTIPPSNIVHKRSFTDSSISQRDKDSNTQPPSTSTDKQHASNFSSRVEAGYKSIWSRLRNSKSVTEFQTAVPENKTGVNKSNSTGHMPQEKELPNLPMRSKTSVRKKKPSLNPRDIIIGESVVRANSLQETPTSPQENTLERVRRAASFSQHRPLPETPSERQSERPLTFISNITNILNGPLHVDFPPPLTFGASDLPVRSPSAPPLSKHKGFNAERNRTQSFNTSSNFLHGIRFMDQTLERPTGVKKDYSHIRSIEYGSKDPFEVAHLLHSNEFPGVKKNEVSSIIGKNDEFHTAVLFEYMNCFDFTGMNLDVAFRKLCTQLHLNGETQQIDRILFQFSRRYWECNPYSQNLFRSIDVVYAVLFSLVLLNTDLHIANMGSTKKMTKRVFVKNTMDAVDNMVLADPIKYPSNNYEVSRRWKSELENLFKDLYDSIKEQRILHRPLPLDSPAGEEAGSSANSMHESFREESSSQVSGSATSADSPFFGTLNMRGFKKGPLGTFAMGKKSGRSKVYGSGDLLDGFSPGSVSGSVADLSAHMETSNSTKEHRRNSSASSNISHSPSVSSAYSRSIPALNTTSQNVVTSIVLEGLLIRKHLTEKDESKPKHRKWSKMWCSLALLADGGVELHQFKLEGSHEIGISVSAKVALSRNPDIGDVFDRKEIEEYSAASISMESKSQLKLSTQQPQIHNVLHSTAALLPNGHGSTRPYVFSFTTNTGSKYLYQAPSLELASSWVETMNIWAARRSKEPLKGGVSSFDYGWGFILHEKRTREREERERRERGDELSNLVSSPTPLPDRDLNVKKQSSRDSVLSFQSFHTTTSVISTDTGSLKTSASGLSYSSMATNGSVSHSDLRRIKLVEWVSPGGMGMIVSQLSEEKQLLSMERAVKNIFEELEEHASFREPMERYYASRPQLKSKALANWIRKNNFLMQEYEKYTTYVATLTKLLKLGNENNPKKTQNPLESISSTGKVRPIVTNSNIISPSKTSPTRRSMDMIREDSSADVGRTKELSDIKKRRASWTKGASVDEIPHSPPRDTIAPPSLSKIFSEISSRPFAASGNDAEKLPPLGPDTSKNKTANKFTLQSIFAQTDPRGGISQSMIHDNATTEKKK